MRPSTDRRQGQPPCCVCGAPGPGAQLFAPPCIKFCMQHACTRRTCKPFTTAPHLHRHASPSLPHTSPAPAFLQLRREGCGVHQALPSSPRRSTPLRPQVVILDFLDTFSSSSRRWCHQLTLYVSFLRSYFRRAVCVVARTGVDVVCRGARRALFCVDSDGCLVKLLLYQAHTGLIHTLGCRGQFTRPRNVVHTTPWKSTHTDTPTHAP